MLPLLAGEAARANPIGIQTEPYRLPGPSQRISTLAIPQGDVGQTQFMLNGGSSNPVAVSIQTSTNEGVVAGSQAGLYAAPPTGRHPVFPPGSARSP
ncbi:hypothetical protein [Rhodopila globiformis]|uniref:hypothetical protein n=1 Tax=Rhodopila globiformis TaxID=1071 RepID=UPI0011B07F75|nr:hypothetical protein [Rhodopila globiformis]